MMDRELPPVDQTAATAGLMIEVRGSAGILTLARPDQRNALTLSMREALATAYARFGRDPVMYAAVVRSACTGVFSAGIDLAEMFSLHDRDPDAARAALADAIRLCWQHECFSKPTVSLIDGPAVTTGFGIGLHGTHRVAGERYAFACPETGLGLVPFGGVCHVLAAMPGSVGSYLALTGAALGRADAFRLGLVTHCVPADRFEIVAACLAAADPVDEVLEGLHVDPGRGDVAGLAPVIARCFSAASIEEILGRLDTESGEHAAWTRETAAVLRRKSPFALKVACRLVAEAATLDLRDLLMLEHRILSRLMDRPDFATGVGTVVVDGGVSPAWVPAAVAEVTPAMVSEVFTDARGPALALPVRAHMQGGAGAVSVRR